MSKLNIKKGDTVLVLSGKDKGSKGKVISSDPGASFIRVEGVNIVTKHQKPRKQGEKGGIIKDAGNINVSNVQVICPSCEKATRVARTEIEGKNARICKKCGASLDAKKVKKDKKTKTKKDEVASETAPEKKKTAKKAPAKKTAEPTPVEKTETPTE